jgi:murein DD-endopeptidase MepM/ murein hydrolase activator NlpD
MGKWKLDRHGVSRAAPALALALLVAACGGGSSTPAPVVLKGAAPGIAEAAPTRPPAAMPRAGTQHVVVEHGQSLSGVAHAYHVTERAIIAANHLTPPYKIEAGQHLVIPGTAAAARQPPPLAGAPAAPVAQTRPPPEIIPLDGPAPAKPASPPPGSASLTPSSEAAPAQRQPSEPSAAEEARGETASTAPPRSSRFPWPVRGHVLAGYGVSGTGSHNDGINIAAPRGAPVAAVDGGTVAYAGNELRGYGNLVLIKHPNGWITAYAHCEELLVKRGDTVSPGQVIAKVGATGGVSEPQLHFELRRGKHAVDPREFLAPAPRAGMAARQG